MVAPGGSSPLRGPRAEEDIPVDGPGLWSAAHAPERVGARILEQKYVSNRLGQDFTHSPDGRPPLRYPSFVAV